MPKSKKKHNPERQSNKLKTDTDMIQILELSVKLQNYETLRALMEKLDNIKN